MRLSGCMAFVSLTPSQRVALMDEKSKVERLQTEVNVDFGIYPFPMVAL